METVEIKPSMFARKAFPISMNGSLSVETASVSGANNSSSSGGEANCALARRSRSTDLLRLTGVCSSSAIGLCVVEAIEMLAGVYHSRRVVVVQRISGDCREAADWQKLRAQLPVRVVASFKLSRRTTAKGIGARPVIASGTQPARPVKLSPAPGVFVDSRRESKNRIGAQTTRFHSRLPSLLLRASRANGKRPLHWAN